MDEDQARAMGIALLVRLTAQKTRNGREIIVTVIIITIAGVASAFTR
jgi:hypothetical protein